MKSFEQRKTAELGQKLSSLDTEFEYWMGQTERGAPLEKHHTQVRRVITQLARLKEKIAHYLETAGGGGDILTLCRRVETMILEIHRIWQFFRAKLMQRYSPWFSAYLAAADDFAWDCYNAAGKSLNPNRLPPEKVKEPPLVFFNGGSSPFTSSRDVAYQPEEVPFEGMRTPEFVQAAKKLPVPVIGVPWFQVRHLPDALVIAHEVGHNVEMDFRLGSRLTEIIETGLASGNVPTQRRVAWHAWEGEIFADLYGALAAGPAFAGALMDFLAMSRRAVQAEKRTGPAWTLYPTSYLRILFCLEVLRRTGFRAECKPLSTHWNSTFPSHAMPEFEADIPSIAGALIEETWPELMDKTLPGVLTFETGAHTRAVTTAELLLAKARLRTTEVRTLFAAARLAFQKDPDKYSRGNTQERLLQHILANRERGVRGSGGLSKEEKKTLDKGDKATGEEMFQLIENAAQKSTGEEE